MQALGYTAAAWDAELDQTNPYEHDVPVEMALKAVPGWKAILGDSFSRSTSSPGPSTSTVSLADVPHAELSRPSLVPSSSLTAEAVTMLRLEAIEGALAALKGMSAAVKEAAVTWCECMDIPSMELLVLAEQEKEFVAQLGVKAGGIQEKMILKRLAKVAAATF